MSKIIPENRNRKKTEEKILNSAVELIAREGFKSFGVNSLAKEAGVDKQLIYRYFSGIDGVIETLAEHPQIWIGDNALKISDGTNSKTYTSLKNIVIEYISYLRSNRFLQKVIAWELLESSESLSRLEASRSRILSQWMGQFTNRLKLPKDIDLPVINAILIGAINSLVLHAEQTKSFAGLCLKSEKDWERVENGFKTILKKVLES